MSSSGSKDNPHVYVFRPAHAWRPLVAIALTLAVALTVAACGGSAPKNSNGRSKAASAFLSFSQCMRAHGVTNFPDPSASGGIQLPHGTNPMAPAFRAARTSCWHLLPGGGPGKAKPTRQQLDDAVATSECMRQHGVTGFPDPTVHTGGPPNLNPTQYSEVQYNANGILVAVPKSIDTSSPAYTHAAQACKFK